MGQWYDDPRGRYEQRWHDGEKWTAHVASGGQTMTDPFGVGPTPSGPRAPPPPAGGPPRHAAGVGSKPDNYLVWAILTTLLCCLPFGIVSIVQATKVDSAWIVGQYDEARRLSQSAKNWATAAGVTGLVVIGGYLLLFVGLMASV